MQMGYNNDVEFEGKTLHIQTEDHGLAGAKITTHVFYSGAILESRTVSYEDDVAKIKEEEEREEHIRKLMKTLHRHFYKRIMAGTYNERLGLSAPRANDEAAGSSNEVLASPEVAELSLAASSPGHGDTSSAPVSAPDAIATLPESIDGFVVAGTQDELGDEVARRSRGTWMSEEELAASTRTDAPILEASKDSVVYSDTRAYRGIDEGAFSVYASLSTALEEAIVRVSR